MLDPRQDAPSRDALAQEARGMIEKGGALKHENTWGLRKLAYEIGQCMEADYRWLRFEAPAEVLDQLNHSLRIADGVLRFRIFRVDPNAPVTAPPAATAAGPGASRSQEADGRPQAEVADSPEPAEESAPQPAAEPPAEVAAAEPPAEAGQEAAGDGSPAAEQ